MDPLQPFLVLSERRSVVSFGAGFSVCYFSLLLAVLKKTDTRRLRCIAAAIFCAQFLFSFAIWKAGLSGKAVFYMTYLCPLFRAGDFAISCCMGCLYHSRKDERIPTVPFHFWSWQLCCFRAVAFSSLPDR